MKACKWWQVIQNKVNVFSIMAASTIWGLALIWLAELWFDGIAGHLWVWLQCKEESHNTLFKNDKALFCLIQDK